MFPNFSGDKIPNVFVMCCFRITTAMQQEQNTKCHANLDFKLSISNMQLITLRSTFSHQWYRCNKYAFSITVKEINEFLGYHFT